MVADAKLLCNSMRYIIANISILAILLMACKQQGPSYLKVLAELKNASYMKSGNIETGAIDTVQLAEWLSPKNVRQPVIQQVGDITKTTQGYMVTDLVGGYIVEVDENGILIDTLFLKGRGPAEFIHPAAVTSNYINGETHHFIHDTGLNLIKSVKHGTTLEAWGNTGLLTSNWTAQLTVSNNYLYWPTSLHEDFLLIKSDYDGNIQDRLISRLLPIGKHPITYNDIVFDISPNDHEIAFAYSGIPVIFYRNLADTYAINLMPSTEIKEINTPLDGSKKYEKRGIKMLVRNIFLHSNVILTTYKQYLIAIKKESFETKVFYLQSGKDQATFHKVIKAGKYLFFVNLFNGKIYTYPLDEIDHLWISK